MLWSSIHVSGEFRSRLEPAGTIHSTIGSLLWVILEESFLESSRLASEADGANSHADEALLPDGWRITNFSVTPVCKKYSTAFGDPAKPPLSQSKYTPA
jgi:hypothetical protein